MRACNQWFSLQFTPEVTLMGLTHAVVPSFCACCCHHTHSYNLLAFCFTLKANSLRGCLQSQAPEKVVAEHASEPLTIQQALLKLESLQFADEGDSTDSDDY